MTLMTKQETEPISSNYDECVDAKQVLGVTSYS